MKKLVIVLIAAAILIAGGITVSSVISNQPEMVVKNALSGAIDELMDRDEFSPIFKVMDGGSVSVKGEYEGTSVESKTYFKDLLSSQDAQIYIEDLTVKTNGEKFSASAYISSDYAYVTDCNLLDDTWGIIRGTSAEDFAGSIFATDAKTALSFPQEQYDRIYKALQLWDDETDKAFQKDFDKILQKYQTKLERIFKEHASFEETLDKVVIGGDRMECRIITVTVDEEALSAMISDLYDTILKDKSLRKLFIKYGNIYMELEGLEPDAETFYEENILDEAAWQKLTESIVATDFELTVDVITPKSAATLRKLVVHVETDLIDEDVFSIDFGKNGVKKSTYVTVECGGHTYAYEIAEDTRSLYEAYFHYDDREIAHLEIDRKKDTFELSHDKATVSGDLMEHSDQITLSRLKVTANDIETIYDISITLDKKDTMPDLEKKDDIMSFFSCDQHEISRLMEFLGLIPTTP